MDQQPGQTSDDQPSWAVYGIPMPSVQDGHDARLHERDWEGQLAAAARGPMQWGFLAFFLGFGGFYLVSLVLMATVTTTFSDPDTIPSHSLGPRLLIAFAPNLLLGLAPAMLSWWKGQGLRRDYGIVPTLRDLRIGLAAGGVSVLVGLVVNLLVKFAYSTVPAQPNPLAGLDQLSSGRSVWLGLIALFVLFGAPLTEELLVRGALWGALEHYRVHRYAILALTALIFAFLHQDPQRTAALFGQGLAIGGARMITGRIGSSMIAHATNNLIPALVLFFVG